MKNQAASDVVTAMSDDILSRSLEVARVEERLVDVYRDNLRVDALTARVIAHGTHVTVLALLSDEMEGDGVVAVRTRDITRLRWGSRELAANASVARWDALPDGLVLDNSGHLELSTIMTLLERAFGHVTLHAETTRDGCCFIGEVLDVDDDFIHLREWGPMRSMDRRELVLRYEEITRVDAGGRYERQLLEAYRVEAGPRH